MPKQQTFKFLYHDINNLFMKQNISILKNVFIAIIIYMILQVYLFFVLSYIQKQTKYCIFTFRLKSSYQHAKEHKKI